MNFFETMRLSTLYLCNAAVGVVDNNNFLFEHGCRIFSDGSSNLIFICADCRKYFKYCLQLQNFCFKELMKCLSEKYLREGEDLALPTEFERLI